MEVTSKCDEFFLWFMTVSYEISISFFFFKKKITIIWVWLDEKV